MKTLLSILLVFTVSLTTIHAQETFTTEGSKITYTVYKPLTVPAESVPELIYLHGYKENIANSYFVRNFLTKNREKFVILIPQTPSGWEFPIEVNKVKKAIGVWFLEWCDAHVIGDGRLYLTGYSAGGDWDIPGSVPTLIDAWAPVAGSVNARQRAIDMGKLNIPVNAWHGTVDQGSGGINSFAQGKDAAVACYQGLGGGKKLIWNAIEGVDHAGITKFAYGPTSGLAEWFLAQGTPSQSPVPAPKPDPLQGGYINASRDTLYLLFGSGSKLGLPLK